MFQLLTNSNKLHTTFLGEERIKENLGIKDNVIEYCKNKILDKNCLIAKVGKNYYCEIDDLIITINASSYTIITVHKKTN